MALGLALLAGGALVHRFIDRTPSRELHDRIWSERMLDGRYGRWLDTGERLDVGFPGEDRIASTAEWARLSRYGLDVTTDRLLPFAGDWRLLGGLVGRADTPGGHTVDLFLKQIARTHWPMGTAAPGRDYAYDVFLVVRPPGTRARVVRQWHIPPADIALFVPRATEEHFRQFPPPDGSEPPLHKVMRVEGLLAIDPRGPVATVTVLGLTRQFEERVDLTEALRP